MNKEFKTTLEGIPFDVVYTHRNEGEGGSVVRLGFFEFYPEQTADAEDEPGELQDEAVFKAWMIRALEGSLVHHLVDDIKMSELYKAAGVNKLSLDATTFVISIFHFNCEDDQRLEIDSNRIVGNTVKGRKYREQISKNPQ